MAMRATRKCTAGQIWPAWPGFADRWVRYCLLAGGTEQLVIWTLYCQDIARIPLGVINNDSAQPLTDFHWWWLQMQLSIQAFTNDTLSSPIPAEKRSTAIYSLISAAYHEENKNYSMNRSLKKAGQKSGMVSNAAGRKWNKHCANGCHNMTPCNLHSAGTSHAQDDQAKNMTNNYYLLSCIKGPHSAEVYHIKM